MDANDYTLNKLFSTRGRFTAPMYQRPYVWDEEEQWAPLWEEIESKALDSLTDDPEDLTDYYLGAIVVQPVRPRLAALPEFEIIDGQQRLTTLQVLLAAMRDVASELKLTKLQPLIEQLACNTNDADDERFKVWPTNADQDLFRQIMRSETNQALLQKYPARRQGRGWAKRPRLVQAYEFFLNEIREFATRNDTANTLLSAGETEQRMSRLWAVVDGYIKLVVIELDEKDDAQVIFESLNGRMTPLLASDLIKNFTLRSAQAEGLNRDELYTRYWEPFDRDQDRDSDREFNGEQEGFWRAKQKQGRLLRPRIELFVMHYLQYWRRREIKMPDLFKEFRQWWKADSQSIEKRLGELQKYSRVYRKMLTADGGAPEEKFFSVLRAMDTTVVYPLLFFLLVWARDRELLVETELPAILQDLESYLVRRMVCDLTKKKYNYVFPAILRKLSEKSSLDRRAVRDALLEFKGDTVHWPGDEEFRVAWEENPLFELLPSASLAMILSKLDQHQVGRFQESVTVDYSNLTIEHVLPQQWQDAWPLPAAATVGAYRGRAQSPQEFRERMLNTIGNLTLLTNKLNPSLSNAAYEYKRPEIVKESMLRLNVYFQQKHMWDESAIHERSQILFGKAKQIWPYPDDVE